MENSQAAAVDKLSNALWTRDFFLICFVNFSMFLGLQLLLPTIPVFVVHLGGLETDVGIVMAIFTVSAMLARPLAGLLSDTRGRQGVLIVGLVIFIIAVAGYNWSTGIAALLAIRFLHGLGWGLCTTASGTIAADTIPLPRMGEGMGYFSLATAFSMAIAPAAGIYFITNLSFTHLFFTSAALAIAALILSLTISYRKVEHTTVSPRATLYEKSVLNTSLIIFLVTATYGAVVSFIVLYAAELGINNIGPFFIVFALTTLISRPLSGRLVDKKGYNVVIVPGMLLLVITMLVLAAANKMWVFLTSAALYGLGFGSVQPSLHSLAVRIAPSNRWGAANGTFFSAFDLGVATGAVFWGIVSQAVGYSYMYASNIIPGLLALAIYLLVCKKQAAQLIQRNSRP